VEVCLALLLVTAIISCDASAVGLHLADIDAEVVAGQQQPKGIDFSIQVCTSQGNCVEEQAEIVTSYVYTGCSDPNACTYVSNYKQLRI
jgi:hypothetical protein